MDEEGISRIYNTLEKMTLEEKIGQLFVPIGYSSDPAYLKHEMLDHHIERTYSQEEKEKIAASKNTRYHESLRGMPPADLSSEVIETLESFRKRRLKMAIGFSSKKRTSS